MKIAVRIYGLKWIEPKELTLGNGWFAGFFDGDGTINISLKDTKRGEYRYRNFVLTIGVSNKHKIDMSWFRSFFGGGDSAYDSKSKGRVVGTNHAWTTNKRDDIYNFRNYLYSCCPLLTPKMYRFEQLDTWYR